MSGKFKTAFAAVALALAAITSLVTSSSSVLANTGMSTAAAVAAAPWAANVDITITDDVVRYQSNGLPDHELPEQFLVPADGNMPPFGDDPADSFVIKNTADFLKSDPLDVSISLKPQYSETTTDTPLGTIGVALSGARIFNDYENQERTSVALDDNRVIDGAGFVDSCNAHPLQSGTDYHYHGVPLCITKEVDKPGEHSHMVGLLLDGFPVYGSQGENGIAMTNADLDECSGHFEATPEFPDGIYHYHLTVDEAPYSIDCFHGTVDSSQFDTGGGAPQGMAPNGQRPDIAAAAETLGVSEHTLMEALGTTPPPDFEKAASALGVTVDVLRAALGPAQ